MIISIAVININLNLVASLMINIKPTLGNLVEKGWALLRYDYKIKAHVNQILKRESSFKRLVIFNYCPWLLSDKGTDLLKTLQNIPTRPLQIGQKKKPLGIGCSVYNSHLLYCWNEME